MIGNNKSISLKPALVAIIVALLFSKTAAAQEPSLALKLLQYCEYITGNPTIENTRRLVFANDTTVAFEISAIEKDPTSNKLKADSLYDFDKKLNEENGIRLSAYIIGSKRYFSLYYGFNIKYDVNPKNKLVQYADTTNNLNISYKEMLQYWGKPIISKIQPKDTYNCSFSYTNLRTGRKAVIHVVSYDPTVSDYNIIYSISISNTEVEYLSM